MEKIFFGGIHGVGKSTIIKELMKEDSRIGHYSFGENIVDIGNKSGILKEYKDIAKIQNIQRDVLMDEARKRFEDICKSDLYNILLVDNHFSVYQDKELIRAIEDKETGLYNKFILIEVPSDILYQRVLRDKKERIMETFEIEMVIKHSKYEKEIALDLQKRLNLNLLNIENIDFDETIKKINNFIKNEYKKF